MIYGYVSLIPLGVWIVLKYRTTQAPLLMDIVTLYGYSIAIFIPVSVSTARSSQHLVSISPFNAFRLLPFIYLLLAPSSHPPTVSVLFSPLSTTVPTPYADALHMYPLRCSFCASFRGLELQSAGSPS